MITNEDNMELMARYEDNYFDLAIVDPPYGIDADKKNSAKKLQSKKSGIIYKTSNIFNNLYNNISR